MAAVTFETFDPTPYQRAPRGNVHGILALSQALVQSTPKGVSDAIDRRSAKLEVAIERTEAGLTKRRRELAPGDPSREVELDGLADVLWGALRSGLELWKAFDHPGLATVLEAQPEGSTVALALASGQDKAARAAALLGVLFGTEGLLFTQKTFPEQAVSMAAILRIISEDGLDESIDTVVAKEILVALQACQPLYEGMVDDRMKRSRRKSTNLAVLRTSLQRAISRYCTAVLAVLDEDEPTTLKLVIDALQPIATYRARVSSGKTPPSDEAGEDGDPAG